MSRYSFMATATYKSEGHFQFKKRKPLQQLFKIYCLICCASDETKSR